MQTIPTKLVLFFFFLIPLSVFSQGYKISGKVVDQNGEGLPGITIQVVGTENGVYSDYEGQFSLIVKKTNAQISFSGIGYATRKIQADELRKSGVRITLEDDTQQLDAVQVIGKSDLVLKRESPFAVTVVDVEPLKTQNLDINGVLNTVSGVRIRETGGLGSSFNFTLNGFSGNQIRFFLDGIPMDIYGASMKLNNIPVNLFSGVEVYKGLVPLFLSTDALGGAVNIMTNTEIKNYANAFYSFGSFNTHRAGIFTRYTDETNGFQVSVNAFYNYSDNNYTMYGMEVPGEGGKPDTVDVERFHDGFHSKMAQIEAGFINKKFADMLMFGLVYSDEHNDVQTGLNMQDVFGELYTTDRNLVPTVKYAKKNLLIDGFDLKAYASYNANKALRVDTSSRLYDWYGDYIIRSNNAGEFSYNKSLLRYDDKNFSTGINGKYALGEFQNLGFNAIYISQTRQGSDTEVGRDEIPFYKPNSIQKGTYAIGYSARLFHEKLEFTALGKIYHMEANTQVEAETNVYEDFNASFNFTGYGAGFIYKITDWLFLKPSFESSIRMPTGTEIFGNGLTVKPNTTIKPEESMNYNAELVLSKVFRNHKILFETGYRYRDAKNFIRLDASQPTNSNYVNQVSVELQTLEIGSRYNYKDLFNFQFSISKQKSINTDETDRLYLDDLPNTPFLYGNAGLGFNFKDLIFDDTNFTINWFTSFVDSFYWKWPSQGNKNDKYDIPRQLSHDLNIGYSMDNRKYTVSISCSNLTNALRYDNFAMQKPGRAFNVKLNYYLQK